MIHEHSADKLKYAAKGRKKRGKNTKTEEDTMYSLIIPVSEIK